jgi:hypothetical protein
MKHLVIARRVSVNGTVLAPEGNENAVPAKCNRGERGFRFRKRKAMLAGLTINPRAGKTGKSNNGKGGNRRKFDPGNRGIELKESRVFQSEPNHGFRNFIGTPNFVDRKRR